MKSQIFYRSDIIFSSIFATLLVTIMISSPISVSYANASRLNATTNMNMNMNMNMDPTIINSNITNTLHHIDQAKAALKIGDTEGAQKHLCCFFISWLTCCNNLR